MSEAFDPYRDWLGLNYAQRDYPLNHYQILGLESGEEDAGTIQHAADKMLARVRGQRPGDRAKDWGRLLDELESARDCLSAPDKKAAYDAGLISDNLQRVVAPQPSQPKESEPLNLDKGAWSPPEFDATPATPDEMSPDPSAESHLADPPRQSSPPVAPVAAPTAAPAEVPPEPSAPADNNSPAPPTNEPAPPAAIPPAAVATGADPMAPVAVPTAQVAASAPVAAPVAAPVNAPAAGYNPVAPTTADAGIVINVDEDTADSSRSKTALIGIAVALLLWVGAMAGYFSGVFGGDDPKDNQITEGQENPDAPSAQPKPDDPGKKSKKKRVQVNPKPRPKPKPAPEPEPTPKPEPVPTPDPGPLPPFSNPDPAPTPDPKPIPTPDPIPGPTPKPGPEPEPTGPTHEQVVAFFGHLAAARKDLTSRDFTSAQRHIDDAGQTVMPPEIEAKRERLQALLDATQDFWLTLGETMGSLKGGEEFKISESTIVRVIEVNSKQLIVRLSGQTLRYPVHNPPMGIARLLVSQSLGGDSPRAKIAIGASWATIAAADEEKARKFFRQAGDAGADTKRLLGALDDDYQPPRAGGLWRE